VSQKKVKQKKCKACTTLFTPISTTQKACCASCALALVLAQKVKEKDSRAKKEHAKRKRKFYDNDLRTRKKAAQNAFNAFIRERDKHQPCISCQRVHVGQYHAGHYKTDIDRI
jgi:hypothetical protein